jgi:hypothetical protein
MKHVTYGEKTLFLADDAADTLIEYAGLLGNEGRADTVKMECIGADGNTIEATFLLNAGTQLVAESTNSSFHEPDASEAIAYMRERMSILTDPHTGHPVSNPGVDEAYRQLGEF